ncbi:acyl carrier protein [Blastococcus sp. CT_GayMR19]|uniref:acyl carrier protein n=1 Tax=Blastococcus sp. CT_GayMR19 TaxID=2559608 RepID=UPI0010736F34|nr:acyl carrier protein [Blastococcus sp. CT_GayMR19]TFV76106.1 acyl carrier protein [Blastococcus sp. CT_GayMR19]
MTDLAHVREVITREITDLFVEEGKPVPKLQDDDILLESGLDSLGFAVIVTRLEESLGYDPFTVMDEPVYPQTLGEFVDIYAAHAPTR